jgi:cytochrome c biogenesis protein CcdA/DsbC/DsbD-like thiol-disulfide interchange protein/thiol-disulfide isomerase/thioredoxin
MRFRPALMLTPLIIMLCAAQAVFGQFPGQSPFDQRNNAADMGPKVRTSLHLRAATAPAGSSVELGIRFRMADRWHIQAGSGSGDETTGYLATSITFELPDGLTAGAIRWPDAHRFTLGIGEHAESLNGYEGDVLAVIPIQVGTTLAPGDYNIAAKIKYQACDDMTCEMPRTDDTSIALRIVASDAEVATTELADDVQALFDAADAQRQEHDAPVAFDDGQRLKADLHWYEPQITPGAKVHLGVLVDIAPTWHIQAGAGSGDELEGAFSTAIELMLPDGWTAEEVRWPDAVEFAYGEGEFAVPGTGYGERALFVIPVRIPADADTATYDTAAMIKYQACDDLFCESPTDLTVYGTVDVVSADTMDATNQITARVANMFENVLQRESGGRSGDTATQDHAISGFDIGAFRWWAALALLVVAMGWMVIRTAMLSKNIVTIGAIAVIGLGVSYVGYLFVSATTAPNTIWTFYSHEAFNQARSEGDAPVLVKFTADWCAICQVNERIIMSDDEARGLLESDAVTALKVDFTGPNPEGEEHKQWLGGGGIPIIAVYQPGVDEPVVIRGQLGTAQPVIDAIQGSSAVVGEAGTQVFNFLGLQFGVDTGAVGVILVLAFIAGFLMNFTPCVLPVIPIKILSLQAHAKNPARCFALGLIFAVGIVTLYAVLGILLAGLITGVEKLDWGEQFTNWWFTGAVGLIVGAMGFGMLGLFTVNLPQWLYMFNPQSDSASGSFFMGVFTAILSTPCTGPLLGATVAWVATQPPSIALLTLVVMGVGMAFPYVLLTAFPKLLERMPSTGPGSELVKQVMGLCLMAVAVFFLGTAAVALSGH